jgi:hypothetical protein
MACKICGRGNCTESFHSIQDQNDFEETFGVVKDRMRNSLIRQISRLDKEEINGFIYIKLDEVLDIIEQY